MNTQLVLHTLSASQSSEKVRWALDVAGLAYTEHRLTPFLHLPRSFLASGSIGASLPLLEGDGESVVDSTRIFEWLAVHRAPFTLIPREPQAREAVMNAESRFDHLAQHVLRCVYAQLMQTPAMVLRLWTVDAGLTESLALRAAYPALIRVFAGGLNLRPQAVAHSRKMIARGIAELDAAAGERRRYLVGQRLSVADITAAAMLAPLACPDEHPVYARADYRAAVAPLLKDCSGHRGLDWVRGLYRRHRCAELGQTVPERRSARRRLRATA